MPHLQTGLGTLNIAFLEKITLASWCRQGLLRPRQGQILAAGIVVNDKGLTAKGRNIWGRYPPMQEAIRAVIFDALGTKPPTPITFAWAPGYDFEVSIWQAPDTRTSRGGITILIKSRYPDDNHPLANEPPYGS